MLLNYDELQEINTLKINWEKPKDRVSTKKLENLIWKFK